MARNQSMREFLSALTAAGDLSEVNRAVDAWFEISALLQLRDQGPAQLFRNVIGASMPVADNLFNCRARYAMALGIVTDTLDAACAEAQVRQIPPETVASGPVQDVVHRTPLDLAALLPVPSWFAEEAGPYITAGVIVAKDPETGRRNVSIARLRMGDDEYDVADGFLGEPLRLIRCQQVDLEVPAEAEIVIEALLDPTNLIEEGAVSEFPGFYIRHGAGVAVEALAVTHRADPVFQAVLPGYATEHCLMGAVAIGATLTLQLRQVIPAVRRVFVTPGGMGRLHAVITMHQPKLGEGKRAVMLAMGMVNLLKLVTVVENDIDPKDPVAVEWSLAARYRGHEDMVVVEGAKADRCNPVHEDLTVTKIGLIATTRPGDGARSGRSELVGVPQDVLARLKAELDLF